YLFNPAVFINSSMWGQVGASCEVHYSAAKAGLIGLTKALAKEVAPSGIRVNCVSPGAIFTDMLPQDKETIDRLKEEIPLGYIGSPEDVANLVAFLASEKASYITGQVIGVNGGMVI
ncbi:MAG TPA: SDR family oxidoreductase, partial [Clostridiales bacterium]|nr:SDR family oxidoreductase [Clostridiales bacterium]